MKIKTLVAVILLSGGVTSSFAQTEECNSNSSISHEAVRAKNYKDAYIPCMAVLRDCPTLRYYTYSDAYKILGSFLDNIKDRKSADYQKYFEELMKVYDQAIQYLPEINKKLKSPMSLPKELGKKAIDYMQYAPSVDVNLVYGWLKEAASGMGNDADGAILHYFLQTSMMKVQADKNHVDQFFQDYMDASKYIDAAIAAEPKENKKKNLQAIKDNLVAMFVSSGVADCESLQNIYGPQVEVNKADSSFLKKAINILKMMKCTESEAYFRASEYMYAIDPTADAAVGVAAMYYKKGDYDTAMRYFDEGLEKETDDNRKAEIATAIASALLQAKKYVQAKSYCLKAISFRSDYGDPYLLLASVYASSPNWSDEPALNKCTYFLVIDKLQRAKAVDPSVSDKANELINTYSRHTPDTKDLFMLGYKAGDRVQIGGWIGESTIIR